jgi:hypothetical protein
MKNLFSRLLFACFLVLLAPFATAQISNTASVTYADAARDTSTTQRSNTVTATMPANAMAETIEYFTGPAYSRRASATGVGRQLYIQATAPACNANPMVAESIVISVKSSKTGDTEAYQATETAANSGIFRIVPDSAMVASATMSSTAPAPTAPPQGARHAPRRRSRATR